jgi:predicted SprT family Zn-dependent metalloprotease
VDALRNARCTCGCEIEPNGTCSDSTCYARFETAADMIRGAPIDSEEQIVALTEALLAQHGLATRHGLPTGPSRVFMGEWRVTFSDKMTWAMGKASYGPRKIVYSRPLFSRATELERRETIAHEVAHVITTIVRGHRDVHGPIWRATMRELGYRDARRCHNVEREDLKKTRPDTIGLVCSCPVQIRVTLARMLRASERRGLRCRKCKQVCKVAPQDVARWITYVSRSAR